MAFMTSAMQDLIQSEGFRSFRSAVNIFEAASL